MHEENLLGRGILDPAFEKRLLAEGVVFARFINHSNGKRSLQTTRRSLQETANNIQRSSRQQLRRSKHTAPVKAG